MKKLMIALAAVACAAGLQAASFSWGTDTKFTDSEGTVITTADGYSAALNGGSIVLVKLVALTEGPGYDWANATVLAGQTAPTIKTSNPASTKGRLSASYTFTFDEEPGAANVLKNGDILGVMFKDSEGNLSQLVYASDMTTTVDDVYTVSGLSNNTWSGDRFAYATGGNFTAVPEPTSGLLMLLGMAGLALRRRRA